MLNNLKWRFAKAGVSATWEAPLPKWFARTFRAMGQVYYYSAVKNKEIFLQMVPEPLSNLLAKYYELNLDEWNIKNISDKSKSEVKTPLDKNKITIMFTGGKDSLHVLLTLLKKHKAENIQCVYIPNINKSESYYERTTVDKICTKAKVKFIVVDVSNSVRINREGHNIGLRDQLLVVLALPYILQFGSHRVIFGLHDAFWKLSGPLFTSHCSAFGFLMDHLREMGVEIKIEPHPNKAITEIQITRELIEKWPEYFWMTNSCYRQLNFRERQHKACQERHPDFKIYHGCGNCIKCLRINGILALYESSGNFAARWNMAKEVNNKFITNHVGDHTLLEIVKLLQADVLKAKHSDVSSEPLLPPHT